MLRCGHNCYGKRLADDSRNRIANVEGAHLSPLGWEHVNLAGDYIWGAETSITENTDGMRPLCAAPAELYQAA